MQAQDTTWIRIGALGCVMGCVLDFVVTSVLGALTPGYSAFRDSMSRLGVSASPYFSAMAAWGLGFTICFGLFALGLRKAFPQRPSERVAFWLMVCYAIGEGVGSGFFPFDHVHGELTPLAFFHSIFGAIGELSLLAFPLAMAPTLRHRRERWAHRITPAVLVVGFLALGLFLISKTSVGEGTFIENRGLWQRIYLLDYYVYLLFIAGMMFQNGKRQAARPSPLL